ncbi:hypothetical protein OIU84_002731 [Salix udensis]|uniref:Uncharacterized protein n=1 Tax=Salix udensis TaxID=889485 RepID=A0AAD6K4R6_9ROSI|nr:hypothetical protein OIU84_002731 [Salix udensis]
MEGMGSRLGRTSARYGLSATATIFNAITTPTAITTKTTTGSRLLLCRWTPLSPAAATSTITEDPPKRKFRYTPIAVLKERSTADKKAEQEVEKQLIEWQTTKNDEQNVEDDFKSETQVNCFEKMFR